MVNVTIGFAITFRLMLNRLQKKWKVSGWRMLLILITFAVGGSLTGLLGKKVMSLMGIKDLWLYVPIYIIIVTIIWPFMVLVVSVPLGQFRFFVEYLGKMKNRISKRRSAGLTAKSQRREETQGNGI